MLGPSLPGKSPSPPPKRPVVIMGAGKLGEALLTLGSFPGRGFRVVAIFDVDPTRVGKKFPRSLVVEPTIQLAKRVLTHNVTRGIIAVPESTAQQAADALVRAGVKVILSYAQIELRVPSGVVFNRIPDPAVQFARLMIDPEFQLPWKIAAQHERERQTWGFGLVRMPEMWTESNALGWTNPVLETIVAVEPSMRLDCGEREDNSLVIEVKEAGFFEFITQHQPPITTTTAAPPLVLLGLDLQLEALRETLLLREDVLRMRGVLLWGPAGCGKSALIQTLASSSTAGCSGRFKFYSAGEDEASLKQVFDMAAANNTPIIAAAAGMVAVVVLDNLHLLCKRRAFKSALLAILDNRQYHAVSILATSNAPWTLDVNLLRHFEKRIAVPLPTPEQRTSILRHHFRGSEDAMSAREFDLVGRKLDGHSSWDVITSAKTAALRARKLQEPVRSKHFTPLRPSFCKEMIPLFASFASRFGEDASSIGTTVCKPHLSMYS
ncbi:hypothetical protein BASA81_000904 [Batrachochytrium salamandrivorans]|nr:hypothetical protein BASA81_000904 [Batrachochytrium salamandrivorans]